MNIKFNGNTISVEEKLSLQDLVNQNLNGKEPNGIAAALNDSIVPRSKWNDTIINENDAIEIVHAVQGG